MENNERKIKDLEKKIEASEAAIALLYERIGEVLFAEEDENKSSSAASSILDKMAELDKESKAERERITKILSTLDRADEIEALRKNLIEKISSIEKDNISNYETIGRASYAAFKSGELPGDSYEEIFGDIIKTNLKIDEANLELERLNDREDEKIFDRLKSKARIVFLKNTVSGYYNQLNRQYKRAGAKICHSELVMKLEAASVENALKPYRENLEGIEKLEREKAELSSEDEKIRGNLEGLGVQSSAMRTVNEIESHINELYSERKSLQREAGELISLNRRDVLAKTAAVKAVLRDIDKENKTISGLKDEIKQVEAAIEIERKNREIEALSKKISGYEEKISSYSQEAEQLKEKIQAVEENIKKLEDTAKGSGEEKDG